MNMLTPDLFTGPVDQLTAWRVIAVARSIAPGIDDLDDGDKLTQVVAILQGVAQEAIARGSRAVASQRVGTASVNYVGDASWFTADDRAALSALVASTMQGPIGHFPRPARVISNLWPEDHTHH